jgi:hypothetical protein
MPACGNGRELNELISQGLTPGNGLPDQLMMFVVMSRPNNFSIFIASRCFLSFSVGTSAASAVKTEVTLWGSQSFINEGCVPSNLPSIRGSILE